VSADATKLSTLTDRAGWPFVWLPDSSGLISYYTVEDHRVSNDGSIIHIDLDGHTKILTNLAEYAPHWLPAISPDGTKIAFVRGDTPFPDIFVMNVDGTDKVQITHNPGYNTCFDWPF
jgi:Tol biopolymer transport system component